MKGLILSFLIVATLVPYLVDSATFDEFTFKGNGTSVVVEKPKKHKLTTAQRSLVEQFRTRYSRLLTDEYLRSESHISGLLESNKWTLAGAQKQLRRIMTWRQRNKIDELNIVEQDPELSKLFPWEVTARARDGCPVLEIGWGRWLVADYIQSKEFVRDGVNSYAKHQNQMWERPRYETTKLAPQCNQSIIIADIKGFLMKNVAEVNSLNSVINMALTLNDKYPNLHQVILCVNAPPDFITLMKTLQPSLGVTAKAFNIYSEQEVEKAKKHVSAYVDPAQLTARFLGTKDL